MQPFPDPLGGCHQKLPEPPRSESQFCLYKPIKLLQRFFVENHVGKPGGINAGFAQTRGDSMNRHGGIVLFAGKTLFLSRSDKTTIAQKSRSTIVI